VAEDIAARGGGAVARNPGGMRLRHRRRSPSHSRTASNKPPAVRATIRVALASTLASPQPWRMISGCYALFAGGAKEDAPMTDDDAHTKAQAMSTRASRPFTLLATRAQG